MGENELLYHCWAYLLLAGAGGLLVGGLVCVKLLGSRNLRLLPAPRESQGAWSGHEAFLVFVFFWFGGQVILLLFNQLGFYESIYGRSPSLYRRQLWVWPLATPLIVAAAFLVLHALSRTRPAHFGMTPSRAVPNAILGYLVWLVLTPVVLGVFLFVVQWMSPEQLLQEQHPLERLARERQPLWPVEWILVAFQATLAIPLLEELVFRGILLGWLCRANLRGHVINGMACLLVAVLFGTAGSVPPDKPDAPVTLKWEPLVFVLVLLPVYLIPAWALEWKRRQERPSLPGPSELWKPPAPTPETGIQRPADVPRSLARTAVSTSPDTFRSPDRIHLRVRDFLLKTPRRAQTLEAFVPICGAALLFAAFHSGVWPSPIPLFVFGLGVGWLAYRTHSLIGPCVVHALFNAVATLVLVMVYVDEMNGRDATATAKPDPSAAGVSTVPGSQFPRFR